MLGYLFLSPIPNPWFESLFEAYSNIFDNFLVSLAFHRERINSHRLEGGYVGILREHIKLQKKLQKFLSFDYVSVKHHIR